MILEKLSHEPSLEPPDYRAPICPNCGSECDTYYRDSNGNIIGCEECVDTVDAWEHMDDY